MFPDSKAPHAQRIPVRANLQGASKIVPAACRDDEHGNLEPHQCWQMTMKRAVSAEDEDGVGLIGRSGQSFQPFGFRVSLK